MNLREIQKQVKIQMKHQKMLADCITVRTEPIFDEQDVDGGCTGYKAKLGREEEVKFYRLEMIQDALKNYKRTTRTISWDYGQMSELDGLYQVHDSSLYW